MEIRRHRLGRLLPVVAVVTSLALVAASCGREVTTEEIQGFLEAFEGKELIIRKDDGTTVRITVESTEATAEAALLIGKPVSVQVSGEDDDRELVVITQRGSDDHFSGVVQSISAEEWVIGGRTFQIDENTMLDEGLAVGVMVEIESFALPDGSLTARKIETREDRDFQFSGEIQSMKEGVWVIGGTTFTVNESTTLDEGLAVGVEARVEFITLADGTMLATEIETDEDDDRNRFSGEIESMIGDTWIVGGRSFTVNAATRLDDDFATGDRVRVRFTVIDDILLATRVQEDSGSGGDEAEFVGEVEFIYPDRWVIGGMTFAVNTTTRLEGDLATGERARVDFVVIDDSKLATRIRPETSGVSGGVSAETEAVGDLRLTGAVESISDNLWTIAGHAFRVDAATEIDEGLEIGDVVRVEFDLEDDGTMLATRIDARGDEEFRFTGEVKSITDDSWVVGKHTIMVDEDTRLDDDLAVGDLARVRFEILEDGTMLATRIEPRRDDDIHFSGVIESIAAGKWVIAGHEFVIDSTTELDEGLAVGVLARVEFKTLPDGTLVATSIETDVAGSLNFSGMIVSITADGWTIGPYTFVVDGNTELDEGLAVGVLARVEFETLPDGTLVATSIETDESGGTDFTGIVQSMNASLWIIGNRTFQVTATTMIDDGVAVGVLVRVDFMTTPQGTLVATSIEADTGSSSTSSTAPSVTIVSPAAGTTPPAGNITVTVEVDNFSLVAPGGAAVAGQGHLHFYLDVTIPTALGAPAVTAPGTYQATSAASAIWENVTAGSHTFGVQLVNNNHTPLSPPVTATVIVAVE